MTKEEALKVLMQARGLIHEHGLAKGVLFDSAGRICTLEALRTCNTEPRNSALPVFETLLGLPLGVTDWNDAPERTEADVIIRFDVSIHALEEAELARDTQLTPQDAWEIYQAEILYSAFLLGLKEPVLA